ncbi:MAG: transglutaminase-like domain-containing protein [Betaproteobacteria bacterium]|jgi:transglutaminase-like putative cysteine protease|nr:transglutaminase-like domain-containing protein [Betaproteobacteria bacterium]
MTPAMKLPPLLLGAALAFWGLEVGQLALGIGLGLTLEAAARLPWRVDLQPASYERLADLCTVFFVGFIVVGAASTDSPGVSRSILAGLKYLPAFIAPIAAVQLLSSSGRLRLSALLRAMRQRKRRDPAARDPLIDFAGPYLAVVLLSAGLANDRGPLYYAGIVVLAAWALFALRPRYAPIALWAMLFATGAGAGYAGHVGLTRLQAQIESWISDWYLSGMDADPYRSRTDIGSIGRLKLEDTIVLRVYAKHGDAARLKLLHRASFNDYYRTSWVAHDAPLAPLAPAAGGATWRLAQGRPVVSARIVTRLEGGKAVLALPAGTLEILQLPAETLETNALGTVRAAIGGEWAQYVVDAGKAIGDTAAPTPADLAIPVAERPAIDRVSAGLGLAGLAPREAIRRVRSYFASFRYATYRNTPPAPGMTAIGDFLERSKRGHCEYFATATTLLLRAAGVPTRYATGFAMLEYSTLEDAYVVRARHAHAWTRAWIGGQWVDLDTTPPDWFGIEEERAPLWQGLSDLLRWASFRWSQRAPFEAGTGAYVLLALLVGILFWRLLRGRRMARAGSGAASAARSWQGMDSSFFAVERRLTERFGPRGASEALGPWIARVGVALDPSARAELLEALELHQKLRFDPAGVGGDERRRLGVLTAGLERALRTT